jgi:tryptophan synthase alpha chain
MIEIESAFKKGNKKAFVAFLTAGDPTIEDSKRYYEIMQDSGVDIIEVGIPFSDPIAEGEVIQAADIRALKNKVCLDDVFKMVESINKKVPFLFMTYANPVFFYGYDKFFARCKSAGVCGVIIPDIPFEESEEVKVVAKKYGITVVDMVAPTSHERINKVCSKSQGFIYLVSSLGVTGMRKEISTDIGGITSEIKKVTKTPVCVGFGISSPEQAAKIAKDSDGAIIGSAIVKIVAEYGSGADEKLKEFLTKVAQKVHSI